MCVSALQMKTNGTNFYAHQIDHCSLLRNPTKSSTLSVTAKLAVTNKATSTGINLSKNKSSIVDKSKNSSAFSLRVEAEQQAIRNEPAKSALLISTSNKSIYTTSTQSTKSSSQLSDDEAQNFSNSELLILNGSLGKLISSVEILLIASSNIQ
jgi:hypothetical protein